MSTVTHRRSRVLVCDAIAEEGVDTLREHFDVDVRTGLTEDELCEIVGDYEALVVRSATRVTSNVIARADRLQVIARAGAGLDTIDVGAAVARDVKVVNAPDANTLAVAELAIGLILALARNIATAHVTMKEGRWEKKALMGIGVAGKTLGLVGFGRIAQAVASRAQALGMRVIAYQRHPTPELYQEQGVERVALPDLLARSDFVSLHVPATPETEHLIDADRLAEMKETAYLINTARGSVVDEDALAEALDGARIAGAALDVWSKEPATGIPLTTHPKVLALPHLGASTHDAQTSAAEDVAGQIVKLMADRPAEAVLPVRFVDLADVVPHEATDPQRVDRIARSIAEEGRINNPPIVARSGQHYVVLDGATRTEALRQLGHRHVVVQDVPTEGLELETWNHVVREMPVNDLIAAMAAVEGIEVEECDPSEARTLALNYGALCSVVSMDGRGFVIHDRSGGNRFDATSRIAGTYVGTAVVSRTLERDTQRIKTLYTDPSALVEYPQFTVEQVLLAAGSGHLVPAGVTRFLVPGRVLGLRIDTTVLGDERPLTEKNRWLHDHLADLQRRGQIRYYREPVYLLEG